MDVLNDQLQQVVALGTPYLHAVRDKALAAGAEAVRSPLAVKAAHLFTLYWTDGAARHLPPLLDMYNPKTVCIALIFGFVVLYNLTARIEYYTKIFSTIFRGLAVYVNALFILAASLIRDHYLVLAIMADAGSKPFFEADTAMFLGCLSIAYGLLLNAWVFATLGIAGVFYGDSFGYVGNSIITTGPFRLHDDPQYLADTLLCLGFSTINQSRLGYGLSGILFIAYQLSVMLLEGPFMYSVMAEKRTRTRALKSDPKGSSKAAAKKGEEKKKDGEKKKGEEKKKKK